MLGTRWPARCCWIRLGKGTPVTSSGWETTPGGVSFHSRPRVFLAPRTGLHSHLRPDPTRRRTLARLQPFARARLKPARPAILDDDRHLSEPHHARDPLDLAYDSGDHLLVRDRNSSTYVLSCQRAQTIYDPPTPGVSEGQTPAPCAPKGAFCYPVPSPITFHAYLRAPRVSIHCDRLPAADAPRGYACSHNRRDAELARHDETTAE